MNAVVRRTLTLIAFLLFCLQANSSAFNLFDELEQRRTVGGGVAYEVYREYTPPPDEDNDGVPDAGVDVLKWDEKIRSKPGNYLGYVSKAAKGMWLWVFTWRSSVDSGPPDKMAAPGFLYRVRPGFQQMDDEGKKVLLEGGELLAGTDRGMSLGKWVPLNQAGHFIFEGGWKKNGKGEYDVNFTQVLEVLDIPPDRLETPYDQFRAQAGENKSANNQTVQSPRKTRSDDLPKVKQEDKGLEENDVEPKTGSHQLYASVKPMAGGGSEQVKEKPKARKRKSAKKETASEPQQSIRAPESAPKPEPKPAQPQLVQVSPKSGKLTMTLLDSDGSPWVGDLDLKIGGEVLSIRAGLLGGNKLAKGTFVIEAPGWKEVPIEIPVGYTHEIQQDGTVTIRKVGGKS